MIPLNLVPFGPVPFEWAPATSLLETESGCLAFGTQNDGLFILSSDHQVLHYNRASGFPSDWIRSLREDREGNLWVGTGGNGVVVLRPGNISSVLPPQSWQGRPVLSVLRTNDGSIWAGTEGAGVYRLKGERWVNYGNAEGLSNLFVWSLAEDAQGAIWVGTWGGGLFIQRGERFERSSLVEVGVPITALYCDRRGSIWVGTRKGLLRCENGHATAITTEAGSPSVDILAITEDREGRLWFGTAGAGLGRLKDKEIRYFKKSDGLSSEYIRSLYCDGESTLWIGTFGGGVGRYTGGKFSHVSIREGLQNGFISSIQEDRLGNIWLGSQTGLIRVSRTALIDCCEGRTPQVPSVVYQREDGLPTTECTGGLQASPFRAAPETLLVCTSRGLVKVDAETRRPNLLPPPVEIESILVDGRSVRGKSGRPVRIPAGWHILEFDYTALSFVAPSKVHFKYRLNGLGSDWIDAGVRRTANFTYIPPGAYEFEVTACNNEGVWAPTPASAGFVLLPSFWQTWWFRVLVGISIAGAAGGVVWLDGRRRTRRELEKWERQQAVENERARIAKDIHDDLGARLTRISMLSQNASSDRKNTPKLVNDLGQIRESALELTQAIGEVVWAIAPNHDTLKSLITYAERFAHSFIEGTGLRCRFDIPLDIPSYILTAETRHNAFLAFKEAVNNAVKHAHASEIRVSIAVETTRCILSIEDNGEGIPLARSSSGAPSIPPTAFSGNGLTNMHTRMKEIGGDCEIVSTDGKGTSVQLIVPLKHE